MNLISLNNLYVQLSAAMPVDVAASWTGSGDEGAGGDLIHITSTTARIVIPAPGSGYRRRMTDLNIRALASNSTEVTATIYQGSSTSDLYEIMSALLKPGDIFTYDHQSGFRVTAQALFGNAMVDIYREIAPQLLI